MHAADARYLTLGVEKSRPAADAIPVHILLNIPAHGINTELTGTVSAQTVSDRSHLRMQDSDILTLVQMRQTIQSVVQFVQAAASGMQSAS